ncbi:hypothetical protein WS9_007555 [Paraclostridium sordellii 8483]|uniref:hypothetical protein n=1 Tax=Paraclostridium sordellii TaxID=1505 RepID=UPI000318F355|nr:hypothetical protein [Paeniclostridium sordellii]TAN67688.1 hypothetical protein WS9_007555 [Paeniclostridium sordellii 8483]
MKKSLSKAKFIINVESDKATKKIKTISVYDNRIEKYLDDAFIKERGIVYFLNVEDLKETLNWNLNGDSSKYKLKWGRSSKTTSEGFAFIFD